EKIPECIEHLEKARELREEIWLSESKPFGFEIIDIRFNGVIGRLCYANRRINDYLEGKTDSLPELEEERIYANPYVTDSPLYVNQWDKIASACSFVGV
ncbi:MAG: beta-N-acetylhexosaminidase, partial [Lachnospiraceae bacterium]|nr:beta-N-acetylhexosaminidase [Lachnospiraceae bacterium]